MALWSFCGFGVDKRTDLDNLDSRLSANPLYKEKDLDEVSFFHFDVRFVFHQFGFTRN
jgi:hypothetical protein